MISIILIGLMFIAGYVIGFVIGAETGRLQGIREQATEDFEFLRLKQLQAEAEQDSRGEND